MKEQLISEKTGLLAKEKGYTDNSKYWTFWDEKDKNFFATNVEGGISRKENTFKQPSQSLLQKWLREVHQIEVKVWAEHCQDRTNWNVKALKWDLSLYVPEITHQCFIQDATYTFGDNGEYPIYENALEKGLLEGLKLIQ